MLVLCHPTALKLEEEIGLNKKSESEILEDGIQEK
jgi:hypothetical protein